MAESKITQKKGSKSAPKSITRGHSFQKIYSTNLIGGGTEYDFRFELFNEKIRFSPEDKWSYISDAMVILTPQAAKKLKGLLEDYLKKYEKEKGEISVNPSNIDPSVENYQG